MPENVNRNIHCGVRNCKNHCKDCDCCSLSQITIGEHGTIGTDCCNFVASGIAEDKLYWEGEEEIR